MNIKEPKRKAYLHPDVMLRYVLTEDESVKKMIEEQQDYDMISSSFGFWEMMICLTPEEIEKNAKRINYLFQKIVSFDFAFQNGQEPLKPEENRIKHLRNNALKDI